MRQSSGDFTEPQLFFEGIAKELHDSIVRLWNTKLEDELSRKGGGNVTVLALASSIPCHVVMCTSAASIGGVERQNSVFMYEPNLVNNFFLL
jgi:hypothetical protein